MDLSHVIIGPVVTEKAERLKAATNKKGATSRVHTLWVSMDATKIEVKKALRRFFDVDAASVRALRVRPKTRLIGRGVEMQKRHAGKKVMVTLAPDSKNLDLAAFQLTSS
jgi:large subunit ribosomal protein L23